LEKLIIYLDGHIGVTKTYNRIKHKYTLLGKFEIRRSTLHTAMFAMPIKNSTSQNQMMIIDQPMMITDIPGSSFDKVAMDIVEPLSKTEKGNEYI